MQSKDTTGTRITASLVGTCRGREGVGKAGGSLKWWEGRRVGGEEGGREFGGSGSGRGRRGSGRVGGRGGRGIGSGVGGGRGYEVEGVEEVEGR